MAGILNFLISNGGTGGAKPQNVSEQGGIMRIVQGFPLVVYNQNKQIHQ